MKRLLARTSFRSFLGSALCFRLTVGLFVLEALWIALSARYPMAFDEDFHLGIIKLYAHHPSPFWNGSPNDGDSFGAVARDPSYLYHYLFSFIYRFIRLFTENQAAQIIILRLVNIGLLATSLPIFRRLLRNAGTSDALIHVCLLIFILIPIVPFLGAQINYDNIFIPLTGIVLLLTLQTVKGFRHRHLSSQKLLLVMGLSLLVSLVKYAFLPIFLAIGLFIAVSLFRHFGFKNHLWKIFCTDFLRLTLARRGLLIGLIVISSGLFVERYGVNIARYHTPTPECDQVLNVQRCHAYGPWIRDYDFAASKTQVNVSPLAYSGEWFYGMWLRSFFTLEGPTSQYQTRGPLTIPARGVIVLAVIGTTAALITYKKARKRYDTSVLALFLIVPMLYLAFLWLTEYKLYRYTGQPVAINGRYLLPILLPLLLVIGAGLTELIRRWPRLVDLTALTVILTLAWGGGALTYIIRSNDDWYWHSGLVKTANHAVQRVTVPVVPGSKDAVQFLR